MENVIIILVVAAVVALAGVYIWRSKKRGRKCVGCPEGGACSGNCQNCSKH